MLMLSLDGTILSVNRVNQCLTNTVFDYYMSLNPDQFPPSAPPPPSQPRSISHDHRRLHLHRRSPSQPDDSTTRPAPQMRLARTASVARPSMSAVNATNATHAWSTTQCKCRSIWPLPAAAATRVDASNTSAASVYSYSVCQIDVMHART